MIDNILFLAPPITACVILSGILSYYGNHILSRGIIFIDIAVAQIAALGTMAGILLGYAEESAAVQYISYGVTIVVLAVFALAKGRRQLIPQEAVIGILYCVALGLALLLAEKIPGGSNYITKSITGNILWVTWKSILNCAIVVAAMALILLPASRRIREVTEKKGQAGKASGNGNGNITDSAPGNSNDIANCIGNSNGNLYDLLFYVTFGVIIVKSVPMLGIFLVFILLIAPAAIVRLYTTSWRKRILWSWAVGAAGSIVGMYSSFQLNISNGPAIVCILGVLALLLTFLKLFIKPAYTK